MFENVYDLNNCLLVSILVWLQCQVLCFLSKLPLWWHAVIT